VTLNAKSHFIPPSLEPMHRFHSTVAFPARDIAVDMPLMVKKHVLCNQIDLHPWGGSSGIKISMFFLYPRMIGDDILVTMQAFFHRRKSWKIGIGDIGVTITALNLFHPAVHLMAERNGLLRSDVYGLVRIEKIHKCSDEKYNARSPKQIVEVFIHRQ
jgi:hypothetical protein